MYLEQGAADCQPSFSMTKEIKIINDCTQLKIHGRICDSIFFFEDRIGYTEMELIKNLEEEEVERERERERVIKLYFSTVKILAQRPTHISAVATVLLITKIFRVKYFDRRI